MWKKIKEQIFHEQREKAQNLCEFENVKKVFPFSIFNIRCWLAQAIYSQIYFPIQKCLKFQLMLAYFMLLELKRCILYVGGWKTFSDAILEFFYRVLAVTILSISGRVIANIFNGQVLSFFSPLVFLR
jgi:hypothetical protein